MKNLVITIIHNKNFPSITEYASLEARSIVHDNLKSKLISTTPWRVFRNLINENIIQLKFPVRS
jgi:hypothetical protein